MKHGFTSNGISKFYHTWQDMKKRCTNKNCKSYKNYGGRGIKVCKRWLKFDNFIIDMYDDFRHHLIKYGPKNTTIERVDNNSDYKPSNCKWATKKEQVNNNRYNRVFTINGLKLNVAQWASRFGLKYQLVLDRLNLGWSIEKALHTPKRQFSKNIP